jgi:hypothetical protein
MDRVNNSACKPDLMNVKIIKRDIFPKIGIKKDDPPRVWGNNYAIQMDTKRQIGTLAFTVFLYHKHLVKFSIFLFDTNL